VEGMTLGFSLFLLLLHLVAMHLVSYMVILKTNPAIAASIENTIENVTLRNAAEIINANVLYASSYSRIRLEYHHEWMALDKILCVFQYRSQSLFILSKAIHSW
jgi:hypothetical protein